MKKTGKRRRLLSLLLTLALVLGSVGMVQAEETPEAEQQNTGEVKDSRVATGLGATVTLQIEGYGVTLDEGTQVKMPDTYKTFAEYGFDNIKEPEYQGFTVFHVLAEYCEQQFGEGEAPKYISIPSGSFIESFCGLPEKNLMFLRNRKSLNVGVTDQKIANGDHVAVVDVWANSDYSNGGQYAWFQQSHVEAEAGNKFTMQLQTTPLMWKDTANPQGATVQVYDGDVLVSEGITDSSGNVNLFIDMEGTYTVIAERRSEKYYEDDTLAHPYDITRAHGSVTVLPEKEVTDKEAVKIAKEALSIDNVDLSKVTQNILLPSKGNKKTEITWESDTPDIVSKTGEVTRPYVIDTTVRLTATITRGDVSEQKIFDVTVIGYSLKLKSLEISGSQLSFSPDELHYTAYVPKGMEEIEISAEALENIAGKIWLLINDEPIFGDPKGTKKVQFPVDQESINLSVKVQDSFIGKVSSTTTITVRRAENIGEPLPELPDITWGQHLGNKENNAVVDAKTPTDKGELLWESFSNAPDNWGSVYAGTPILANGSIYAVRNNKIEMLDARTGEVQASTALKSDVGFYSNITCGGGMIFVPLGNGMIDCFNARTLKRMYLTEQPGGLLGGLSVYGSIHYDNGKIYVGYADWGSNGYYAVYDIVDTNTDSEEEVITPLWKTETPVSYYGSGAVTTDKYVVIAGSDGKVTVLGKNTGTEISNCQLQGRVVCALVMADGYIWTTTKDRKIYKLSLDSEGNVQIENSADLSLESNASPVVIGGKVYVTGGDFENGGFFAVYDTSLQKLSEVKTKGQLNTPTVTTAYDDIYVYFTENAEPGILYMAKVSGSNRITITLSELYVPQHSQSCMSKVVVGSDGTLYYGNDAGYLYAVKQGAALPNPEPSPNPSPAPTPEPGGQDGSDGKTGNGGELTTTTVKKLSPTTKKINAVKKKSQSESLADAIRRLGDKGDTSLTVKNVPDRLEADVFAALKNYPDFRLVLDCGSYTISMKGSDVTNPSASFDTKLIEMEGTLSEKDAKAVGDYQQLALIQKGAFPGNVTVVYKLPKQLAEAKELYLSGVQDLAIVQKTVVDSGYAMFVLSEPGEYVLAEKKAAPAEMTAKETREGTAQIAEALLPEQTEKKGMPTWLLVLLGVAAGLIAGGIIGGVIASKKRKKEDTWER